MRFFERGGWPAFIHKFSTNHRLLLLELSLIRTWKPPASGPEICISFDGSRAGLEAACNDLCHHPELGIVTGKSKNTCLAAVSLLPRTLDASDLEFADAIQLQKNGLVVAELKDRRASPRSHNLVIVDLVHFEKLVHCAALW